MNNVFKSIILGSVALGTFGTLTSCSDFLDQKSPSDVDDSNVWGSVYYTKNVLNNAYALLCGDRTYSQDLCYAYIVNSDCEFVNAYGESKAKTEGWAADLKNYYATNDASYEKMGQ